MIEVVEFPGNVRVARCRFAFSIVVFNFRDPESASQTLCIECFRSILWIIVIDILCVILCPGGA